MGILTSAIKIWVEQCPGRRTHFKTSSLVELVKRSPVCPQSRLEILWRSSRYSSDELRPNAIPISLFLPKWNLEKMQFNGFVQDCNNSSASCALALVIQGDFSRDGCHRIVLFRSVLFCRGRATDILIDWATRIGKCDPTTLQRQSVEQPKTLLVLKHSKLWDACFAYF